MCQVHVKDFTCSSDHVNAWLLVHITIRSPLILFPNSWYFHLNQNSFLPTQLSNATSLLDQAQQPYNYLIDSIRSRDTQIEKHKDHIGVLEEDIGWVRSEVVWESTFRSPNGAVYTLFYHQNFCTDVITH